MARDLMAAKPPVTWKRMPVNPMVQPQKTRMVRRGTSMPLVVCWAMKWEAASAVVMANRQKQIKAMKHSTEPNGNEPSRM